MSRWFVCVGNLVLAWSGLCALASCAQPNQDTRPKFSRPPPNAFIKDSGFVLPEDDAGNGEFEDEDAEIDEQAPDSGEPDAAFDPEPDAGTPIEPIACVAPMMACGASCVDHQSSAEHCGACDHKCPTGGSCVGATCTSPDAACTIEHREGHDYLFCSTARTWNDARASCRGFGMDLVVVADEAENTFITRGVAQWIGALDRDPSGPFHWVDPSGGTTMGPNVTYTAWNTNQPDNASECDLYIFCTRENCVEILESGKWNDNQCENSNAKNNPYICESY